MRIYMILALWVISSLTLAAEIPSGVTDTVKDIQALLKVEDSQVSVKAGPMAGLYEAVIGSEILYISANGQYFVTGDVYEAKSRRNLTDEKRTQERADAINAIDDKELIVFAPEKETLYTVNVFTDVDCQYCAKFHNEVSKLNAAGVKVRYFSFPRAGVSSNTYKTMVSVWCSKDQQQAITDAKARRDVKSATCDNPITQQYELGQRIGVTGTPALVLSDGNLIPGYVPAEKLISYLQESSKR